jgi:hypothetical protein
MQSFRSISVLFVLLALATSAQAQADIAMHLRAGDWLRVRTHAGAPTTGRLMAVEDGWLRLNVRKDRVMELPLVDVERLEVSLGRRRGRSALVGAGAGLLGGVLVGALIAYTDSGRGGANMAAIGVPLFTVPAGALLGALVAPHRYLHVSPPYRMSPRNERPGG